MRDNIHRNGSRASAFARSIGAFFTVVTTASLAFGLMFAGHFVAGDTSEPRNLSGRETPALARAGGAAIAGSVMYGADAAPSLASTPISGKGMWIWLYDTILGGDPKRIVKYAVDHGLSHIYVRSGSSNAGLRGWEDVAAILPVAHEAGLKVIAWDFPYLRDPGADVRRARWVLSRTVAGGHSVDGFAADVETRSEGTVLTRTRARNYATWLRANAKGKFIVLVPPPPNSYTLTFYPYDELVPHFDAVAPMVYWGRRAPDAYAAESIRYLKRFGKPIAPIGQSFDMGPYGGPKGPPSAGAIVRFMDRSQRDGSVGVSFWSWQHTPKYLWHTINTYRWNGAPGR